MTIKNKMDTFEKFKERALFIHAENYKWWHDIVTGKRLERNMGELIMLTISEIAEAMEGERKNLMDDHLPHRKMAEVEIADAYIRFLDICGFLFTEKSESISEEEYNILNYPSSNRFTFQSSGNKAAQLLQIVHLLSYFDACYADDDLKHLTGIIYDVIYSLNAYCNTHDYDLQGAYEDKVAYNRKRKDHSIEERLKENGKKF